MGLQLPLVALSLEEAVLEMSWNIAWRKSELVVHWEPKLPLVYCKVPVLLLIKHRGINSNSLTVGNDWGSNESVGISNTCILAANR